MHPVVAATLRRLEREKRSGVIRTMAAAEIDTERAVLFENGGIVGARSSSMDERLGEVMVRRGRISESQLEAASVVVISTGRRLGDVLVALKIVAPQELDAFVRAQLTEIASMLLRNPPRKLEFRTRSEFNKVLERPVRVADAILEASRHAFDSEALLALNQIPRLTPESNEILDYIHLASHEAFVLSRCDGRTQVQSIMAQVPLPQEDTARILLGLELAGVIQLRGTAVAEDEP
ncbi:MAG TPA: DUF4388 domain-containing protein [Vicinamibacteria bacterium]|nr:DUF4388 domain-containing protein [Vicinamibacteria bacterium]